MAENHSTQPVVEEKAGQDELVEPQEEQEAQQEPLGELERVQSQLAEAEARAAEYLDGWQRARAEFANFKRRQEQQQQAMRRQATARLVEQLIDVLDDQERAFGAIPEAMQDDAWVTGFALVDKKLRSILEKEGLSEMPVKPGDDFDPYHHQAILHEPSAEFEEGQIVDVLQKGYNLQETVLRPAIVRVSSGKTIET